MCRFAFFIGFICLSLCSCATDLKEDYVKWERMVPMRDGVKLYTAIYIPRSTTEKVPIIMVRTPYSCNPYGTENYRRHLGPSPLFAGEKYIYVYQDVRGRYMSEGTFEEVTPHIAKKSTSTQTDESSDTYDTVEWLLHNIAANNGKVGIYGISYPGFYATAALPNAHPAIKAVSPQAPVTDEFEGDDAYHRGAFFLMDNFGFMNGFDHPRQQPWKQYPRLFTTDINNAYDFYLQLGPLKNANDLYFKNRSKIWNEYVAHHTKDEYWQARNIRTHLKNIQPAVLVVGGWFDAEDLFGALETYKAIEKNSPRNNNRLVMGPWNHGGWTSENWNHFGHLNFGSNTSAYFQQMEYNFFNFYLKDKGSFNPAEATVFETGSNTWREYSSWPPENATSTSLHLNQNNRLELTKPTHLVGKDQYVSDPAHPVPYINTKGARRDNTYMIADQTFASQRSDVLSFTSDPLTADITLSGPITARLFVTTTGTDADFVVKVIDVSTDSFSANKQVQTLVRAEVLRGKFRNSYTHPEPFTPNKTTRVEYQLNDVAHTFKKGHRMMVQVQSSWFPLVDRNPNKFMNIFKASEADFQKATITIFHNDQYPSAIEVMQLPR